MRHLMLLLAAALLGFIGVAHSYLGERFVFRPLFALADLPLLRKDRAFTENVLRYACYLLSITFWDFAAPAPGARVRLCAPPRWAR
jgi:hypothetical protein